MLDTTHYTVRQYSLCYTLQPKKTRGGSTPQALIINQHSSKNPRRDTTHLPCKACVLPSNLGHEDQEFEDIHPMHLDSPAKYEGWMYAAIDFRADVP